MSAKKNILFYTGHCDVVGGDVKYLFELIDALDANQFNFSIYTDENKELKRKLEMDFNKKGHQVYYLPTKPKLFQEHPVDAFKQRCNHVNSSLLSKVLYRGLNVSIGSRKSSDLLRFFYNWLTLRYIRLHISNCCIFYKLFKKEAKNIDIFHFNNGGYPAKEAGLVAIMLAKWFGIKKIIMTIHNEPVKRRWYRLSDYIFDAAVAKYCFCIIVPSKIVKQQLAKVRYFPAEKIRAIYCGLVDQKPLTEIEIQQKRKELGLKESDLCLLISGNYEDHRKGHDVLFEAVKKIILQFPNIKILIAGDGTPERKQVLVAHIQKLGIEEKVIFLGYRTDIHALNAIVDIAIVPSKFDEATPYTIKEASRAATPVITTTAGGCAEAVEDGETGLIVPPNNAAALAEAIAKLLADKALRARMGQAGRKLFLDRFLLADKINETIDLYLA